jgi:hypothetical protein
MVWQLVIGAFLVLLPFALLLDLHPDRERLDATGRPLRRDWHCPEGCVDRSRLNVI